jgi:hypothetical protein
MHWSKKSDLKLAPIPPRLRPRRGDPGVRRAAIPDLETIMSIRDYAPRDDQGWRVPREGTVSRTIYDLTKAGLPPKQIGERLGIDPRNASVLVHRFKHPEKANEWQRKLDRTARKAVRDAKAWGKIERLRVAGFRRQSLLDYLIRHPDGATVLQLMSHVYSDDRDGGPEGTNIISVMVRAINVRIEHRGFKITATGGPGSIYSLVRL